MRSLQPFSCGVAVLCVYIIMSHSLKCIVWALREVALAASFGKRRPSESEPTYCVVTSDQLQLGWEKLSANYQL